MTPLVRIFALVTGMFAASLGAQVQGTAPASLAGMSAIIVITNGSGAFAPVGAARMTLDRTGTTFSMAPLTANLGQTAGTYTYTKTGPATGQITLQELGLPVPITYSLVFSTETSAAYGVTHPLGTSAGIVLLENGVLSATSAGSGLLNMSVRATVPVGGQIIPGIVLDKPARVLVRVAGPALAAFGVTGTLPDPRVSLLSGAAVVASNDNWNSTVTEATAKAGAFAFATGSRDAALVADLPAGAYTCVIAGGDGTTGEVLLEVYRVAQ